MKGVFFNLVLRALLPDDLFFPIGGFFCTFLTLVRSDFLGTLSLSRTDTVGGPTGSGGVKSDSSPEELENTSVGPGSEVLGNLEAILIVEQLAAFLHVLTVECNAMCNCKPGE